MYTKPQADVPRAGSTPGSDAVQLFDLADDPWEMVNLAEDAAYREVRERLEAGLRGWQESVGDPLLAFE